MERRKAHLVALAEHRAAASWENLLCGLCARLLEMSASSQQPARLDRSAFEIGTHEDHEERHYWHAKSPLERLEALEQMRQIMFGYDPLTTRLQRVLTVTRR